METITFFMHFESIRLLGGLIWEMTKRGVTNDAEDKLCGVQNPPQDR